MGFSSGMFKNARTPWINPDILILGSRVVMANLSPIVFSGFAKSGSNPIAITALVSSG